MSQETICGSHENNLMDRRRESVLYHAASERIGSAEMTPEELKRFDEASNHPYECKCELCKEWWKQVPPEDDETEDE
jgi:hypothetical protein